MEAENFSQRKTIAFLYEQRYVSDLIRLKLPAGCSSLVF